MAKGRPKKNIVDEPLTEITTMSQSEQTITGPDVMHVYLNHQGGLTFILPTGEKIPLNGSNMAKDLITNGLDNAQIRKPLEVGTYGYTCIPRSDWEAIKGKYGHMKLFRNEKIFATADKATGDAKVASFGGEQKHGLDPIDTTSSVVKTDKFNGKEIDAV